MQQEENLILETERLYLKTTKIEHSEFIQKIFPIWDIVKYLTTSVPWPYPADGAYDYLSNVLIPQMKKGEAFSFVIQNKNTKEYMGLVTYTMKENVASRGFWLGLDFHGNGYMTEAVNETNRWIFENTDIEKIEARNVVENKESRRVKEKQGFKLIGIFDVETPLVCKDFKKEEVWELTREAWLKKAN